MQMTPFPAHYQSVYTNFYFSSFSRISCKPIRHLLEVKRACIGFDAYENNLQTPIDKGTSGIWSDTVCHLRLELWRNVTRRHGEYGGISKHWQSQRHRRCIEQRRLFAHFFGSFEIWSDKLKVLYNRHTESRRGRRLCNVTEVPMAQRATEV